RRRRRARRRPRARSRGRSRVAPRLALASRRLRAGVEPDAEGELLELEREVDGQDAHALADVEAHGREVEDPADARLRELLRDLLRGEAWHGEDREADPFLADDAREVGDRVDGHARERAAVD